MPGLGTLLNVCTVLAGSGVGVLIGGRFSDRTRDVVTDAIGLVTLMVAALDGASILDPALRAAVGSAAPVLIVLGSALIGGVAGAALRIEDRLDQVGAVLQGKFARAGRERSGAANEHDRFVQGFVTASLIYCVGPLTILGSLQDGLGQGFSQLALKSVLDGFTSIALASSLGWGVAASAVSVLVIQGGLTAAAAAAGGLMTAYEIAAMTATGGLLLAGLAIRLLRIRPFPVADLLPALAVAPLLADIVAHLR